MEIPACAGMTMNWWTQRESNPRMTTTWALPPVSPVLGERAPADTRHRASSLHPQPCAPHYFNCHRCYSATGYIIVFGGGTPCHQCALETDSLELGARFELAGSLVLICLRSRRNRPDYANPALGGTGGEPNRLKAIGVNSQDPGSESGMSANCITPAKNGGDGPSRTGTETMLNEILSLACRPLPPRPRWQGEYW